MSIIKNRIIKNREIKLEERKKIQLEMLDEIDSFCRANNIKYSIAFGTLLGAVRHKGFIPWDDDVDIMMPLPDLLKFKKLFKSEKLSYLDVDICKTFEFDFSRIGFNASYRKVGLISKTYGISIDLYIMIGIPKDYSSFFEGIQKLMVKRLNIISIRRRAIKLLPLNNIPYFSYIQRKCRDYMFEKSIPYADANLFYVIAGPLWMKEKMIYDRDLFTNIVEVQFEDRKYMAIADWDYYLSLRYGNYMELPPEKDRHPYHGEGYYWK